MAARIGVRGISRIVLVVVLGVNEALGLMGRANLLDRMLSRAFGSPVTPAFNLLVIAFGLALILGEIHQRSTPTNRAHVTPRLVARETRLAMMDPTEVSMDPGQAEDALLAAMAAFEYDPEIDSGPRVMVRAELWFEQQGHKCQGGGTTHHVATGYWRDSPKNQALFGPGVRHELVVAVNHRGSINAVQGERAERSDLRHSTCTFLAAYPLARGHNVKIRLTQLDETTHQRLAANTFHYVLDVGENELKLEQVED